MATKFVGRCAKLTAVVFTSLVAPVLVNLTVRETTDKTSNMDWDEHIVFPQLERPQPIYSATSFHALTSNEQAAPYRDEFAASQSVHSVRIIVRGGGRSPELALQDALHAALRQASASLVDTESCGKNWCAGILRDSESFILGWQELGVRKDEGRKGLFYSIEAAVEVNLSALANRLRASNNLNWSNPLPIAPNQLSFAPPRI